MAAINSLLRNPEEAREMGRRGREYVKENFQWGRIAARLIEILEKHEIQPLGKRRGKKAHEESGMLLNDGRVESAKAHCPLVTGKRRIC